MAVWTAAKAIASLAVNGPGLGIQSLPHGSLATHRAKALDVELLACLLASLHPELQGAGREVLLPTCGAGLAHNLTVLVFGQGELRQATRGLLPPSTENQGLGELALTNLALFHRLHGLLHGLLGFHRRLRGLLGFHGGLHRFHGLHRENHGCFCFRGKRQSNCDTNE